MKTLHITGWLKSLAGLVVIMTSLYCAQVYAGYITMVTHFSMTVTSEGLALEVTAENRGDVPAHDVQFEVILDDRVLDAAVEKKLGVAEKTTVKFPPVDLPAEPGHYPVVIRTYYRDAAGHRFTALVVGFYDYRNTASPVISVRGQQTRIPLDGKGQLAYIIRNEGDKAQTVELALYLPNELSVANKVDSIEIGPLQQETIRYEVENYSALANSSYPVSLLLRYEDGGVHYAVAGSAIVRVAAGTQPVNSMLWVWFLLGGLVPAVMVFLRWKRRA